MSTITLEVPDELLGRIRAKAKDAGQDSDAFAVAAILAWLDTLEADEQPDPNAWFDSLTPDQRERHMAQVEESLAAIDAGRTVPGDVVHQRLRQKHDAPRPASRPSAD